MFRAGSAAAQGIIVIKNKVKSAAVKSGTRSLPISIAAPYAGATTQPVAVTVNFGADLIIPPGATAEDVAVSLASGPPNVVSTPWSPEMKNMSSMVTFKMGPLVFESAVLSYINETGRTMEELLASPALLMQAYGFLDLEIPLANPDKRPIAMTPAPAPVLTRRRLLQTATTTTTTSELVPPVGMMFVAMWWNFTEEEWSPGVFTLNAYNSTPEVVQCKVPLLYIQQETERYYAHWGSGNPPPEAKFLVFTVPDPNYVAPPNVGLYAGAGVAGAVALLVIGLITYCFCTKKKPKATAPGMKEPLVNNKPANPGKKGSKAGVDSLFQNMSIKRTKYSV